MEEVFGNNFKKLIERIGKEEYQKLRDNMSSYQRKIMDKFETGERDYNKYELKDLVFDFDSEFVEKILNIEINMYLEECKGKGIINKKNGVTQGIELSLEDGILIFNRPRLRHEKEFDSILIPKRTRIMGGLRDNIILLYSKNNSINDIKEILSGMFEINVSTALISRLASEISEDVLKWRNRELPKAYFALNIDCTYIDVRDYKSKKSHSIPVYVAVGTRYDGHKEIAGIYLGNEDENKNVIDSLSTKDVGESKTYWLNVFNDLKDRGLEKINYLVSDGVVGMKEAVEMEYSDCFYQRCVVHLVRNLSMYVDKKQEKTVIGDFKKLYTAPSLEVAMKDYEKFKEKYENKKAIMKHASEYFELIKPIYGVPENIRKYIYTNNIVESTNSKIKRGFYGRGCMPNIQSAINVIYLNLKDLEKKWSKKVVPNWNNIYKELLLVHKDDILKYTENE